MKAWELLSDESKWCRNAFARNSKGRSVGYLDDDAVSWCATGAIMKIYNQNEVLLSHQWDKLCNLVFNKSWWSRLKQKHWFSGQEWHPISALAKWNDDPRRTYKEVYSTLKELDI